MNCNKPYSIISDFVMSRTQIAASGSCSTCQTDVVLDPRVVGGLCVRAWVYNSTGAGLLVWTNIQVVVELLFWSMRRASKSRGERKIFLLSISRYNNIRNCFLFFPNWHYPWAWSNDTVLAIRACQVLFGRMFISLGLAWSGIAPPPPPPFAVRDWHLLVAFPYYTQ